MWISSPRRFSVFAGRPSRLLLHLGLAFALLLALPFTCQADEAPICGKDHVACWGTVEGVLERLTLPTPSATARPTDGSTSETCTYGLRRKDGTLVGLVDGKLVSDLVGSQKIGVSVVASGELVTLASGQVLKVGELRLAAQAPTYPRNTRCGCCGCRVRVESAQEAASTCTMCKCGKLLKTCVGD